MVPIQHPKEAWEVCIYTNTFQDHWRAIASQVESGELGKPLSEQLHIPLAIISESFKGAATR